MSASPSVRYQMITIMRLFVIIDEVQFMGRGSVRRTSRWISMQVPQAVVCPAWHLLTAAARRTEGHESPRAMIGRHIRHNAGVTRRAKPSLKESSSRLATDDAVRFRMRTTRDRPPLFRRREDRPAIESQRSICDY